MRATRQALLGAVLALAGHMSAHGQATGPAGRAVSVLPQVRVVQEMHTARVAQLRADARFEALFSIAADKSLRIWRLSDLRLIRTVYLPSEEGHEGTPYAIAVSADGSRAFVAGHTGYEWRGGSRVYVVDTATGLIVATLGHFGGEVVTGMDLSPDGRQLAVGLGRDGLVIIDASTGSTLATDRNYGGPVSFVHYARDGRLATTAADGCLRVYAGGGRLTYRNQYPARPSNEPQCTGAELGGVRFSPDGRWLAMGTRYLRQGERWLPEVALFDAQDMKLRRVLRAEDPQQRSLCCIAWAPDSSTLFVNGTAEGSGPTPLYRVRGPADGAMERWNVGQQQFTNMLPLPDGTVVFSTTVPSIAKVSAEGRPIVAIAPGNVDFHSSRGALRQFLVSPDGRSVAFDAGSSRWLHVRPLEADANAVIAAAAQAPSGLEPARRRGAVEVRADTGDFSHREPVLVNGHALSLGFEEGVRSWAVHATLPIAALGTQFKVRLVDGQGRPAPGWEEPPALPAPAHHTVISEDGRWVVVAIGDGTIRWYEVRSGHERLSLFVHANGSDWVAWHPDGYYASSPAGDQYVGWLVNRGDSQAPDFYRAVQFERTLYRPNLLRSSLDADKRGAAGAGKLGETLAGLSAPRVRIERLDDQRREVRFTVEATGRPLRGVGLFVEGIPVLDAASRRVPPGTQRLARTVVVPRGLPLDRVRVEAESEGGLGLDETAALKPSPGTRSGSGRLHVVAIGVETFEQFAACSATRSCRIDVPALPNAPSDAAAIAARLGERHRGLFAEVRVTLLAHGKGANPTKAAILTALRQLEGATADDTSLVFFASHGVAGGPGGTEYYFLPSDAGQLALERITEEQNGRPPPRGASFDSLLSATELTDVLRRVAGRRIVAIDTCHAGAAGIPTNPYSIAKRSASAQFALITSARGSELAHEHIDPRVPHGAFTEALLRALDGAADKDGDGTVTLEEAFGFVGPEVRRNVDLLNDRARQRNNRHEAIVQTPTLFANDALRSSGLASVGRR